jgi:hypothetical protein
MTILLILAYAAFTAAMLLQTARLFFSGRDEAPGAALLSDDMRQLEELVALRAQLLSSLRELELDYELEKISGEDYKLLKQRYERQAVQIMRKLDTLYGGRGWEASIEAELDTRLTGEAPAPRAAAPATPVEETPAIAQEATPAAGWTCHACARELTDEDMFCGRCGASRSAAEAAPAADEPPAHDALTDQAAPRELTEPATP